MKRYFNLFLFLFLCSFFYVNAVIESWPFGKIHVVGDSHAPFCFSIENSTNKLFKKSNNFPREIQGFESFNYVYSKNEKSIKIPFNIYWLGPRTMHRVGRDGLNGLNLKKLIHAQKDDIIVYVFGEIDVRCHIIRQACEKDRIYEEIINKLVGNYIHTIVENTKYSRTIPIVFSVIPPANVLKRDDEWAPYGDLLERVRIAKQLNQALQKACKKNNILCLNVNKKFQLKSGLLNPKFIAGAVHISPIYNDYIKDELIKLILEKLD